MEDGVLMAPAPYAAPAAYYFPFTGRMEAIEITKGAAAIKYGPSTVGGAINMLSTSIPDNEDGSLSGSLTVLGGEDNTLRAHGNAGGWMPLSEAWDVGVLLETLQDRTDGFKTVDGGGDTGYVVQDYVGKLAFRSKAGSGLRQAFEFKVQVSDETSDETYLGLTAADFAASPYRRYAASRLDEMNVDHKTFQATHRVDFSNDTNLTTTAYTPRPHAPGTRSTMCGRPAPYMDRHIQCHHGPRQQRRTRHSARRCERTDPRAQQQPRILHRRYPVGARHGFPHRRRRSLRRNLGALSRGRGRPLPEPVTSTT